MLGQFVNRIEWNAFEFVMKPKMNYKIKIYECLVFEIKYSFHNDIKS